ncbi:MAG: pseudouridine synthase, partial [Saprospiraceae bacterium]
YYAVVNRKPDPLSGKLTNFLIKNSKKNISRIQQSDKKGAKKSVLEYELGAGLNGYFLLKINPITGRPHQIRVQLSNIGCPIVGDLKYGYSRGTQDKSICLHCNELSFIHPIKKEKIVIEAEMPRKQYWDFFTDLVS